MSKPSWDTAPSWAQWLAQDEDGCWNWFALPPSSNFHKRVWDVVADKFEFAGAGERNRSWYFCLEQRQEVSE